MKRKNLNQSLKTMYFVGGVMLAVNSVVLGLTGVGLPIIVATNLIYFGLIPASYSLVKDYLKTTPKGRVLELLSNITKLEKVIKTYSDDKLFLMNKRKELHANSTVKNKENFYTKYFKYYNNYKESAENLNKSLAELSGCSEEEIQVISDFFKARNIKYDFKKVPELEFFSEIMLYKHEKEQMLEKDLIKYENKINRLKNIYCQALSETGMTEEDEHYIRNKIEAVKIKEKIAQDEVNKLNIKAKNRASKIGQLLSKLSGPEQKSNSIFLHKEEFVELLSNKTYEDDGKQL